MIRFGVAARLIGRGSPGLPRGADLSLGLLWLIEALSYLERRAIPLYRLPDTIAAAAAGGDVARMRAEIGGCGELLREVRARLAGWPVRLTMHLPPELGLGVADAQAAARASAGIVARALLLEALGGERGVIVAHMGAGGPDALERASRLVRQLPEVARALVAVEVGEQSWGVAQLIPLQRACGAPIVWDALHHQLSGAELPAELALALALSSWPAHTRPKIHISTQRTEAHLLPGGRGQPARVVPPRPGQHADFLNPFEVGQLLRAARGLPAFDIMIEAKAGDLALARLREDLERYRLAGAPG